MRDEQTPDERASGSRVDRRLLATRVAARAPESRRRAAAASGRRRSHRPADAASRSTRSSIKYLRRLSQPADEYAPPRRPV